MWYREPDFMVVKVIQALREELMQNPQTDQQQEYLQNVDAVLAELKTAKPSL